MIEAKNLAKAMKTAAKNGGYRILMPKDGENLYIWTETWCVVLNARRVPRVVLAAIVEKTGELPTPGTCGAIFDAGMQTIVEEMATEQIRLLTANDEEKETFVNLSPIRYSEQRIYQAACLNVFAISGAGISIIERSASTSGIVVDGSRLFFVDNGDCLILPCRRPSDDPNTPEEELQVWEALESCELGKVF